MSLFNFAGSATVLHLAAAASNASTLTGSAVDLAGYNGTIAIVQSHGASTGTLDGKIQDSADGSTGWTDVAGATFAQSTTTADVKIISLDTRSCKRYIRYVGTIVTGPQVMGVVAVGVKQTI